MGSWDPHLVRKNNPKLPDGKGTTPGRTHRRIDRQTDGWADSQNSTII